MELKRLFLSFFIFYIFIITVGTVFSVRAQKEEITPATVTTPATVATPSAINASNKTVVVPATTKEVSVPNKEVSTPYKDDAARVSTPVEEPDESYSNMKFTVIETGEIAYIRTDSDMDSSIITSLQAGDSGTVELITENCWALIDFSKDGENIEGYIYLPFIVVE